MYLLFLSLLCLLVSCNDDVIYPVDKKDKAYNWELPNGFPDIAFDTVENPITENGVALGKRLFYEGKLSRNNTISCGFCHIQEFAFTHHGHNISHGIDNRLGIRNAPAIQNMAFLSRFTWDGVGHNLDERSLVAITDANEMDSSLPEVITKLNADSNYRNAFKSVFGDENITSGRILKAISQFLFTLVSADSKFDRMKKGTEDFSLLETEGMKLFEDKCGSCHSGALFTDQSFRNNGLYYNAKLDDRGRYRVTLDWDDNMKFRVPSLRNVEFTAPYMHDGRFYTLEAVLNFYTNGVENHSNLDPAMKTNGAPGIPMTAVQKNAIIAFLKTLSDPHFISNKEFAE